MDSQKLEGEVAESNTGRWTKAEHELFLRGLTEFGKDWKQIGSLIRTRTVVQIRTHAQKYFLANKKQDDEDSLPSSAPAKVTTKKRLASSASTKGKSKKKKDEDDMDLIFDLVDSWSSESDEGTPTALDELDFLRGSSIQGFPQVPSMEEHKLDLPLPQPIQLPAPQSLPSVEPQPLPHAQLYYQPYHQQQQQQHHQQQQHDSIYQYHHRQEPAPVTRLPPNFDTLFVDTPAVQELHDQPNTLDPLPSLEYVHFGRWMETMTEST